MGILTKIFGGTKKRGGRSAASPFEVFSMKVKRDIFPIVGRGVVVTGAVESGTISSGEKVFFTSRSGRRVVCCADVQAGGDGDADFQTASAGMVIALLLKGADFRDVEEGVVISGRPEQP